MFKETYGRTDLPTASPKEIMLSFKRLFRLPDETNVYPGHGEKTTIAHEKKHNMILFNDI